MKHQSISSVALVVRGYDEAIAYYTEQLGFELVADNDLGNGKRWVQVAPRGSAGTRLLLARAATPEQAASVGNQTGGRVFLFLATDDFWRDYREFQARGVRFVRRRGTRRTAPSRCLKIYTTIVGIWWNTLDGQL